MLHYDADIGYFDDNEPYDDGDMWRENEELSRIKVQPYSIANPAREHPDELKNIQKYSRLTPEEIRGPLQNRRNEKSIGHMDFARTPEEILYVADRMVQDTWANDWNPDETEADLRVLENRVKWENPSDIAMEDLNKYAQRDYRRGLELIGAEQIARTLGLAPMIDGDNGYINPRNAPFYSRLRLAGTRLTEEDAADLIFDTMFNQGREMAKWTTVNLPNTDAITAARAIELMQAAKLQAVSNVPSHARDGYIEGVAAGIANGDKRVEQMVYDISKDILGTDRGRLDLWMRHGNSDPNIIRTQDGKPSSISFYAQPNGEYVAAHESKDRETYGHLVDGIHRDQNKVLRNADEAMKYAQWLGGKDWYTNYVNPVQPLSMVKQFSPVGGDFVDWRTRAVQARR